MEKETDIFVPSPVASPIPKPTCKWWRSTIWILSHAQFDNEFFLLKHKHRDSSENMFTGETERHEGSP